MVVSHMTRGTTSLCLPVWIDLIDLVFALASQKETGLSMGDKANNREDQLAGGGCGPDRRRDGVSVITCMHTYVCARRDPLSTTKLRDLRVKASYSFCKISMSQDRRQPQLAGLCGQGATASTPAHSRWQCLPGRLALQTIFPEVPPGILHPPGAQTVSKFPILG